MGKVLAMSGLLSARSFTWMEVAIEKGIHDRRVPERSGIVHAIFVGIELLVRRANCSEEGKAGFRRADVVAQTNVDDNWTANSRREVDPIEVVQRLPHLLFALWIETEIVVDLLVRVGMGQAGGIHKATQVGCAGRCAGDFRAHG